MGRLRTAGFIRGAALGYGLGSRIAGDYDAAVLKEGLGDAGQRSQVSEEMVGQDAHGKASEIEQMKSDEFNRARDAALAANPEDTAGAEQAGLASARQYDPAIAEARRLGGKEKPGYAVGKETFDTPQAAQAAAAQKNTQGMADVYRQHGRPEEANRLTQQAQSLEAGALALKGAKRDDAVQSAMTPLKLAQIQHEVDTWPQELERRVIAKEVSFDDAQREAGSQKTGESGGESKAISQTRSSCVCAKARQEKVTASGEARRHYVSRKAGGSTRG